MAITYSPCHPTFVAEASGVDFDNITPEVITDLKAGLAKVGTKNSAHINTNHSSTAY